MKRNKIIKILIVVIPTIVLIIPLIVISINFYSVINEYKSYIPGEYYKVLPIDLINELEVNETQQYIDKYIKAFDFIRETDFVENWETIRIAELKLYYVTQQVRFHDEAWNRYFNKLWNYLVRISIIPIIIILVLILFNRIEKRLID